VAIGAHAEEHGFDVHHLAAVGEGLHLASQLVRHEFPRPMEDTWT
jgi:hypothetical protein